jgi:hypothetical protein
VNNSVGFEFGPGPAEMVSDAYINFMHQRSELSSFVRFYHQLARTAIKPQSRKPDLVLFGEYKNQSVFFLENYICRISDFFEVYIDELIFSVCMVQRDFLTDQNYNKAKTRLEKLQVTAFSDEDIVYEAAINFGRKDRSEISEYFKGKLGFDLSTSPAWDDMILCSKIRNLIVHQGSKVDERFVDFAKNLNLPFEVAIGVRLTIPEEWLLKLANKVDACICSIDENISNYVQVHKTNRFGHFWIGRSAWVNPLENQEAH